MDIHQPYVCSRCNKEIGPEIGVLYGPHSWYLCNYCHTLIDSFLKQVDVGDRFSCARCSINMKPTDAWRVTKNPLATSQVNKKGTILLCPECYETLLPVDLPKGGSVFPNGGTVPDPTQDLINERGKRYGRADHMYTALGRNWATLLNRYFGTNLPDIPPHVALIMMVELKLNRMLTPNVPHHQDNYDDAAAYVRLAQQVIDNEKYKGAVDNKSKS